MKLKVILLTVISLFSIISYGQKKEPKGQPKHYIFFLHNKFLEEHSLTERHSKYGVAEYKEILDKLRDKNTIIISEKRKAEDPEMYALRIKKQIDSLIKMKIPAGHISVVGTSQGGYIAQYVSYYMKNPELTLVLVGSSFKDDSLNKDADFRLYGKILSINEKSDDDHIALSQQERFRSSDIKDFKEIELNTGLHHGFLFKALDAWIIPTKEWIFHH